MYKSIAFTQKNCCKGKLPTSATGTELLWHSCGNLIRLGPCWGYKIPITAPALVHHMKGTKI